jgi:hypothetical protein
VILLAIDEVIRWGHIHVVEPQARSLVPDADKLLRVRVRERLEKHALQDAEDGRVGADADGERDQRNAGKHARSPKAAKNLSQLTFEGIHWLPPIAPVTD